MCRLQRSLIGVGALISVSLCPFENLAAQQDNVSPASQQLKQAQELADQAAKRYEASQRKLRDQHAALQMLQNELADTELEVKKYEEEQAEAAEKVQHFRKQWNTSGSGTLTSICCESTLRSDAHGTQEGPPFLGVEEIVDDIGLLQPLPPFREKVAEVERQVFIFLRVHTWTSKWPVAPLPHTFLRIASEEGPVVMCFGWAQTPGNRTASAVDGEVFFYGPNLQANYNTVHEYGLSINPLGQVQAFVDGHRSASISAKRFKIPSTLVLDVGSTNAESLGSHVLEMRLWYGTLTPLPTQYAALTMTHPGSCPRAATEPWSSFRQKLANVLACATDPMCALPSSPYRLLAAAADEITYTDTSKYKKTSDDCPLGFATAHAVLTLSVCFEKNIDMHTVMGLLKHARSYLAYIAVPHSALEPTFGFSRPLSLLRHLEEVARSCLTAVLNIPAEVPKGYQRIPFQNSNASKVDAGDLPEGLCVCVRHSSSLPLARLRNTVESLATGHLFILKAKLVVFISLCGNPWSDPASSESWYLKWLQARLHATFVCGEVLAPCGDAALVLNVPTSWHLLPFSPSLVVARIKSAALMLQSGAAIAVSLSEKSLIGVGGVTMSSKEVLASAKFARGMVPSHDVLWALAQATPGLTGGTWDMEVALSWLSKFYQLFAMESVDAQGTWSDKGFFQETSSTHVCGQSSDLLCVPSSWKEDDAFTTSDVWLTLGTASESSVARQHDPPRDVALSLGLFNRARSDHYDSAASAEVSDSLGTPDCFACDLVPHEEDFTLFLAPLDVIGPCRELYSNLLIDALEALQIASFQGPHVTVVEPLISNAVWRKFTTKDVDQLRSNMEAEGQTPSIYSLWNAKTSCGLRHGSATRFGDMFDWDALASWLRDVRGIRGGVSWSEFLTQTQKKLDVLVMMGDHPNDNEREGGRFETTVRCADDDTSISLRFFDDDFLVNKRVCVRSKDPKHQGGFQLRFLDLPQLAMAVRTAVSQARAEGRRWASVGLFFYWVEGAERARLHPGRYGFLSSHNFYASIWQGVKFAPSILQRAQAIMMRLGLAGKSFLAAHWRRGDWFLGPHPRKLEQAAEADAPRFAEVIRKHLSQQNLERVFLMTNAPFGGDDVMELRTELSGFSVVQAPVLKGHRHSLRQLCIEMAVASAADFFVAFGDGVMAGMASMPSLLVMQMRLHDQAWPITANAFSFVHDQHNNLGF